MSAFLLADKAPASAPHAPTTLAGVASLSLILERATAELQTVLGSLRDNRAALEAATLDRLQQTSDKLRQVTSTTEGAATDILDALERAGALVDDLEAAERTSEPARAQAARDQLRDEIFSMMGALQFQDITTQQLAHAAALLAETEARLVQIARLFDPAATIVQAALGGPDPRTFDPGATTLDSGRRQALADAIFA